MAGGSGGSDLGGMGASAASPPLQWIEFASDHVVVFGGQQAKLFAEFTEDVEPKQIKLRDQPNPLSISAVVWRSGIFRVERDRLIICWTTGERLPPTEFVTEDHYAAQLLILRREWKPSPDLLPPGETPPPPPRATIPFTADEAKRYQEAWARSVNMPVEATNSLGMKLRLLPAGAFDPAGVAMHREFYESVPAMLSRPLYVAAHEVTVAQFRKFVEATGYKTSAESATKKEQLTWRNPGIEQDSDQHPVVRISWLDANLFCGWLSETEHEQYRLPTLTEWAFAAQAGLPSGSRIKPPVNARLKFFDTTAPIGGDTANLFGLHDLFGNVGEWCQAINPPTGHVTFGGSFRNSVSNWSGKFSVWLIPRHEEDDSSHSDDIGFRVVREIPTTATDSPPLRPIQNPSP